MKHSFTLIIFFLLTCCALGQQPKVTADTFSLRQRLSNKTLILRSDSTYCLRESGCAHTFLSMGFWTKQKNILSLSSLYFSSVKARTETLANEDVDDSIITFQVQDCYGNSIPRYFIDFFTKDLLYDSAQSNDNRTDERGILKIKRNNSIFFTTETDQNNLFDLEGEYNDINYRPIAQNAKKVIITVSYPKKLVDDNSVGNVYYYKSRKFKLAGKQLFDSHAGYNYASK